MSCQPGLGRPSKYPPQFQREAVDLVLSSGRTIKEVADSLGMNDGTLSNWVRAARDAKARAEDPDGLTEPERAELTRLRKENLELRTDREILRKAAAFFARETMR